MVEAGKQLKEGTVAFAVHHVLSRCEKGCGEGLSGAMLAYIINTQTDLLRGKQATSQSVYAGVGIRPQFEKSPHGKGKVRLKPTQEALRALEERRAKGELGFTDEVT